MSDSVLHQLQALGKTLGVNLDKGGRYNREKIAVLVGYLGLSLCMILWSFPSTGPLENDIGAKVDIRSVDISEERWFLVQNQSREDWTHVKFVLDDRFFWKGPAVVPANDSLEVSSRKFHYDLYVPRVPRAGSWMDLSQEEPPLPVAQKDHQSKSLKIITDQGYSIHPLDVVAPQPKKKP